MTFAKKVGASDATPAPTMKVETNSDTKCTPLG